MVSRHLPHLRSGDQRHTSTLRGQRLGNERTMDNHLPAHLRHPHRGTPRLAPTQRPRMDPTMTPFDEWERDEFIAYIDQIRELETTREAPEGMAGRLYHAIFHNEGTCPCDYCERNPA